MGGAVANPPKKKIAQKIGKRRIIMFTKRILVGAKKVMEGGESLRELIGTIHEIWQNLLMLKRN